LGHGSENDRKGADQPEKGDCFKARPAAKFGICRADYGTEISGVGIDPCFAFECNRCR